MSKYAKKSLCFIIHLEYFHCFLKESIELFIFHGLLSIGHTLLTIVNEDKSVPKVLIFK